MPPHLRSRTPTTPRISRLGCILQCAVDSRPPTEGGIRIPSQRGQAWADWGRVADPVSRVPALQYTLASHFRAKRDSRTPAEGGIALRRRIARPQILLPALTKNELHLKISGINENYFRNGLILPIEIMLCSKFH
jgi:hypothetical protein